MSKSLSARERVRRPRRRRNRPWLTFLAIAVILAIFHRPILVGFGRLVYPFPYRDAVEQHAERHGLDPLLVAAVIREESGFDPRARSGVGARGLMQIMPRTAKWAAPKAGVRGFGVEDLEDPETNIRLGCWYLAYLSRQFEGDLSLMLAAYNGGEGNVARWRKARGHDPEDMLTAAFPETRRYVKRGLITYRNYQFLYRDWTHGYWGAPLLGDLWND
jgi:soluble lytic murein transglycosylase